jgi:hypothetical protein
VLSEAAMCIEMLQQAGGVYVANHKEKSGEMSLKAL